MKKLLAIIVLGLLFSGNAYAVDLYKNAYAEDFYLKGATPASLMEMGFKLQSVIKAEAGGYDYKYQVYLYTFVKEKHIASCKVILDEYKDTPRHKHECFNITNIEN